MSDVMYFAPHHTHALLEWYALMGVDEAIAEVPLDYRILGKKRAAPAAILSIKTPDTQLRKQTTPQTPLISPSDAVLQAKALADSASTLEALYTAIRAFDGCALKKTAMNTVLCDGNAAARIMVIGEAPEEDDDRNGIPFSGENGHLLSKIFASIGLTRLEHIYFTNMVFWRPPGRRSPSAEEHAACRPFTEKHIALMRPEILILVGGAATALLKTPSNGGFTKLRGSIHPYHCPLITQDIPAIAMLHPSHLLQYPVQKRLAWADALLLRDQLKR
jgi:uracil-DNA glycosylase